MKISLPTKEFFSVFFSQTEIIAGIDSLSSSQIRDCHSSKSNGKIDKHLMDKFDIGCGPADQCYKQTFHVNPLG